MRNDHIEMIHGWIRKASRAPSAHNTQPAQWHIGGDDKIYLIENQNRHLKIADSSKHDQYVALGAAYEGLAIAASEEGYSISQPQFDFDFPGQLHDGVRPYAVIHISGDAECDPLASAVNNRVTYRGRFRKPENSATIAFLNWVEHQENLRVLQDSRDITSIAIHYDQCALKFAKHSEYYKELYSWLRFNNKHPNWNIDGLNADALCMSKIEQLFGQFVVHPKVFKFWKLIGLAKLFISEKNAILSAPFIIVLTVDSNLTPFDTGRYFYRFWLELTLMGLLLCPMSALSDHPDGRKFIEQHWPTPSGKRLVNIFRAGVANGQVPLPAPRLSLGELLI